MKKILLIITMIGFGAAMTLFAAQFPKVEGWTPESEVQTYHPNNLWEIINGAAEQFLTYGFVQMTMQDIKSGDLIVTVYIYDMGSALNAYGVYTTERGADDKRLPIGTESILLPPFQALQLKNQYYVKIDAFEGEIDTVSGHNLLQALEKGLPGSSDIPGELASLPQENKIVDSERYIKQSFLGLSELDECIYARYEAEDKPFRIFHVVRDEEKIWQRLTEKWKTGSSGDMVLLYREIPYQGPIGIIKTEKGLFGVTDMEDVSQMNERLDHLKKMLK